MRATTRLTLIKIKQTPIQRVLVTFSVGARSRATVHARLRRLINESKLTDALNLDSEFGINHRLHRFHRFNKLDVR